MEWNTLFRRGLAMLALAVGATCTGAVDAPAATGAATLARLLDPHTPADERSKLMAQARERADQGDMNWQYVAGSLLAQAPPASPVPTDAAKALVYLSHAAIQGKLLAMAEMAELEIAAGNAPEATTWAQIYAHYQAHFLPGEHASDYSAELLARSMERLDDTKAKAVGNDVAAFLERYDAAVQRGAAAPDLDGFSATARAPSAGRRHASSASPAQSGFADLVIAFDANGEPTAAWPIAVPPRDTGSNWRDQAMAFRMPAQAAGTPPRYLHTSLLWDDGRFHLRGGRVIGGRVPAIN